MKHNKGITKLFALILALTLTLMLVGCFGGSDDRDRTCAWCNGTGYSGNGAKNATEYVLKKTPCKHCNGTGSY